MKKLLTIVIGLVMILGLVACGAGAGNDTSNTPETTTEKKGSEDQTSEKDTGEIDALIEKYANLESDNLKWEYDSSSNTITISGEGSMRDYSEEAPEWDQYYDKAQKIVIENKVTGIGAGAFLSFTSVNELKLGDAVEYIGNSAFNNCIELRTVNFPANLKYIGDHAFGNDLFHSDKGFVLPEGLLYIGEYAFHSAFKESFVSIPASLTEIGEEALTNCFVDEFRVDEANPAYTAVDGVLYSKDMTAIVVYPATKKQKIYEIPDTVTKICKGAIQVTNDLEKIIIPASVKDIEETAIFWNYGLKKFEVDEKNKKYTAIEGVLFSKDEKYLVSYPIGSERKDYTVPEGMETIYAFSMSQANNVEKIHIMDSTVNIDDYAFYNCTSLKQIYFPTSVEKVGKSILNQCDSLEKIIYASNKAEFSHIKFDDDNDIITSGGIRIEYLK